MWRFKPFMQKEQAGLEGRCLDVGNIKVHVKNVIAEGGFSSVYLARDAVNQSKLYALKHMICNDGESLDLVLKEISVMKSLKGHPNVVNLQAHAIFDMGRTKEAIIVMDFCEKSLVNVLESRGAGYFEEKQVLTIFRDICNAVFAMHCQSPPIAHRDLKAENLLLGSDGIWKLCDFGSTSTNHKRIEKPEEMGIEEDNIRKHTTPAYRAPEMWDLFRRDLISEKVDIWALGCLLFRICYFKSAFDGESKLQILNGNYRIPDLPKYSSPVTDLIQDMLQLSPEARPDITQVWFRVNELLPAALQKSLPDQPPDMCQADSSLHEGISKPVGKASVPRRTPASPPPSETQSLTPAHASGGGAPMGAFWSTQHAKDSLVKDDKNAPRSAEESTNNNTAKNILIQSSSGLPKDNESRFFQEDSSHENVRSKETKSDSSQSQTFQDEAFSAFVADFDTSKLSSSASNTKSGNKHLLEAEVVSLREQLRQVTLEKAEIGSKYEKLSAICRSQRQEIQELKQDLASGGRSTVKDGPNYQSSSGNISSPATQRDKTQGTVWELQQGSIDKGSTNMDSKPWQAFADDLSPQATPTAKKSIHSVRTRNGRQIKQNNVPVKSGDDGWGFGVDSFSAVSADGSVVSKSAVEGNNNNNSQRFRDISSSEIKPASQPAGWAGF